MVIPFFISDYRKSLRDLNRAGVIGTDAQRDGDRKRKRSRTINLVKDLTIHPLYLETSIFLFENTFRGNPQNNHFGTVNAMLGTCALGVLTGGFTGYGLGLIGNRFSSDTVSGAILIGAVIGGIGGGYLGYRYRNQFKSNRGLYYGAAAFFSLSIIAIRF